MNHPPSMRAARSIFQCHAASVDRDLDQEGDGPGVVAREDLAFLESVARVIEKETRAAELQAMVVELLNMPQMTDRTYDQCMATIKKAKQLLSEL